jgi:SAM-dependent MidA family methyltransferase
MAQGLLAQTATQGKFLENLGIRTRLARLVTANPAKKPDLTAGVDRITANDKMGTLFKVLCIYPANQPMPAGFI